MTERLHFHFPLSCIGEGNGNPLQCSCLENPMDGEAWWAAVHGVAQSRTRLKRLSNSRRFPEVRNHTQFEEEVLKGHFKRMVGFWQMGSWKGIRSKRLAKPSQSTELKKMTVHSCFKSLGLGVVRCMAIDN